MRHPREESLWIFRPRDSFIVAFPNELETLLIRNGYDLWFENFHILIDPFKNIENNLRKYARGCLMDNLVGNLVFCSGLITLEI